MNIPPARTGFGATLARWGVHPGPYLVLPLLGPYTLRDGFGFMADFGTAWAINFPPVYQGTIGWVVTPVAMVDTRSNTDFRYYGTGSVFEYDDVRFLYVRKTLIQDDAIRLWHRSAPPDPQGGSRPMSPLGLLAVSVVLLRGLAAWGATAIWFQAPGGTGKRQLLIGLWLLFSMLAVVAAWWGHARAALGELRACRMRRCSCGGAH